MVASSPNTRSVRITSSDDAITYLHTRINELSLEAPKRNVTRKPCRRRAYDWKRVMHPSPMRYRRRAVVEEELHNNYFDEMDTSSSYSRQSTPELSSDSDEDQSSRENSLFSSYDPPTPTPSGNELDSAFNNIRAVDDINYTLRTVLYEPPCRHGRGDSMSTLNQSLYHFRPVVWEEEDDLTMADDDDLE